MRIVENLAIAWLITSGPVWPWNMVAGYWLLLLRLIRSLIATGSRNAANGRLPIWRVATALLIVVLGLAMIPLALAVRPEGGGD